MKARQRILRTTRTAPLSVGRRIMPFSTRTKSSRRPFERAPLEFVRRHLADRHDKPLDRCRVERTRGRPGKQAVGKPQRRRGRRTAENRPPRDPTSTLPCHAHKLPFWQRRMLVHPWIDCPSGDYPLPFKHITHKYCLVAPGQAPGASFFRIRRELLPASRPQPQPTIYHMPSSTRCRTRMWNHPTPRLHRGHAGGGSAKRWLRRRRDRPR